MADGLLSGVLPAVLSKGNQLRSGLNRLLDDPALFAQGLLQDANTRAGGLLDATRASVAEDRASFNAGGSAMANGPATQRVSNMLADSYNPMGVTVWHGSPHTFNKFDASKIGTGEGAQVYGHGLYLAENPAVAKQYADTLSDAQQMTPAGRAARALGEANGDMLAAKQALYREYNQSAGTPYADAAWNAVQVLDKGGAKAPYVYKVDLPDEHVAKMLDWDKPLSAQSLNIRQAARLLDPSVSPNAGGSDVYKALAQRSGPGATEALRGYDIPGVRYLDGGSRGAGVGSSNFVVFPGEEGLLQILERNGQPLR